MSAAALSALPYGVLTMTASQFQADGSTKTERRLQEAGKPASSPTTRILSRLICTRLVTANDHKNLRWARKVWSECHALQSPSSSRVR